MSTEKALHDQIRRQGHAALREMQTWPKRKLRKLTERLSELESK